MHLNKMTWQEIDNIDFNNSVVFFPISPLEEHSYHLPIGTDCFLAEKACEMSAKKLKEISDIHPFIFPVIPLGIAKPTSDFPGTISMPDNINTLMIKTILLHISNWGFKYCVVISTHLDLAHIVSIHAAIKIVQKEADIKVAEPTANWVFGAKPEEPTATFGEIEKEYPDIHAGKWETSLMLHLYPELVRNNFLQNLPHRKIENIDCNKTWRAQGIIEGHMGIPSLATSEIGKSELWHLEACAEVAIELLNGNSSTLPDFIEEKVNEVIQNLNFR
ncbi:MAG: creatininase family protein [Ruminiclostridium sp.]|nr:creatininase family protein [Ruminiclostridium sp.]